MTDNPQEHFEQTLQGAIKASLQGPCAGATLRARLLESLAAPHTLAPQEISEIELSQFESALGDAVYQSQQDWAVDDSVALRVENALVALYPEGKDLRSERALHAAANGGEGGEPKGRFLQGLCHSVSVSQSGLVATAECRARIEQALAREARPAPTPAKVIPLAGRSRWKRGLAALASIAACAALIFGTLVGGAEKALADSVRKDHTRCCSALKGSFQHCVSYQDEGYGPLPKAPLGDGWMLVASKLCQTEEGRPMVHNVYLREGKTMSLHFLPPEGPNHVNENAPQHEIADDNFPVLAWENAGWTVTACSTDLDLAGLRAACAQAD